MQLVPAGKLEPQVVETEKSAVSLRVAPLKRRGCPPVLVSLTALLAADPTVVVGKRIAGALNPAAGALDMKLESVPQPPTHQSRIRTTKGPVTLWRKRNLL